MNDVLIEEHDHVGVVRLNRPPANYFSLSLIEELADSLNQLADDGVRAIVLGSAGKHFSAGADLAGEDMRRSKSDVARRTYAAAVRVFEVPVPVVASVRGAAVGGGLGLACAADFRVASPDSSFHANFSSMGFHHGFGLTVSLPRLVGQTKALDLLVSGRRITGDRAHKLGLVDRMSDDVEAEAMAWATEIATSAPLAVRGIKQTMVGDLPSQVASAVAHELDEQERLWATRDSAIGIAASLNRTTPVFTGS